MTANIFLATIGQGLARASRRSPVEWSVEFLIPNYDVRCLAADPFNPHVVYAGIQGNEVLRSNDGGKTWYAAGLTGQIVKALAGRRGKAGTIYAGTKPVLLFVSRDGRAKWTELASFHRIPSHWFWFSLTEKPFAAYVQAIALSPTDGNSILVGIEAGVVVRSLDGGQTWRGHLRC